MAGTMLFNFWRRRTMPMLLLITHAKAGSTWIDGILRTLFGKGVYPRGYHGFDFPVEPGRVATVFISREQFQSRPEFAATKRLIVLRDLRDTLVSRYFSLRGVHQDDPKGLIAATRSELQGVSAEEGMRRMLQEKGMIITAEIQRSWLGSGEEIVRYEDLIRDDLAQFHRLFLEKLQLPISERELDQAVRANSFSTKFGRELGEEDASSHGRKGSPGDWRNHFTPALAEAFHEAFGETLLASGAETDKEWFKKL